MNRMMTDSSLMRTSCVCASLIFLSMCYSVKSWMIVPTLSLRIHAISATGSNHLPSSPPSCARPPQKVGIACASRSTKTTLARYAVVEDGNGQDMPPRSLPPGEPFAGRWWSSLWVETGSWQEYFAFLRVNYEMDLGGAAVTAVEVGSVPVNVPHCDVPLTTAGDDIQDEQLSFSVNATVDAYNDGGSGSSSDTNFSAGVNAALLKEESNVLETSKDHQQSAETALEDGRSQGALAEATEIMASRGESDAESAERAYRLLDVERGAKCISSGDGGDGGEALSLLTKATAAALLSWIRCKTDGNGLVITDDGGVATSDTAERQKLWAAHAPTVLKLLAEVGKEPASDPELQQLYTEAIMYSTSSQGILEAFVTGKALSFTSAMSVLVKKFPKQDNGVAYIFQGSYLLAAPWPIRSPTKARESFEKAVKVNGRSRRNLYYAGVGRLSCGDRCGAAEMFRRAASDEDSESASAIERDIATVLRAQSQRGLVICERGTGA